MGREAAVSGSLGLHKDRLWNFYQCPASDMPPPAAATAAGLPCHGNHHGTEVLGLPACLVGGKPRPIASNKAGEDETRDVLSPTCLPQQDDDYWPDLPPHRTPAQPSPDPSPFPQQQRLGSGYKHAAQG